MPAQPLGHSDAECEGKDAPGVREPEQAGERKAERWKKGEERRQASQEAFTVGRQAGRVRGRTVLLVDDITTTGGTLRACARALKSAGAVKVLACCLAHTEG